MRHTKELVGIVADVQKGRYQIKPQFKDGHVIGAEIYSYKELCTDCMEALCSWCSGYEYITSLPRKMVPFRKRIEEEYKKHPSLINVQNLERKL